ncbi:uncharacterized protein METZ01_LOCUS341109, partial [marine metagenome]
VDHLLVRKTDIGLNNQDYVILTGSLKELTKCLPHLKRTDSGFEKIPVTGQKLMLDTWQGIFL